MNLLILTIVLAVHVSSMSGVAGFSTMPLSQIKLTGLPQSLPYASPSAFSMSKDDEVVELTDDEPAEETGEKPAEEKAVAPFLSQGEISDEAVDLSDPKQARVMVYIILSLLPVLFLIPLMLGSRDLIPQDLLPPVEI
eukprot:scaffold3621_cov114-Cylindrotheca_fusiformis.AAC.12